MTSIRERLLTAIAARLTPVIATAGGRFLRQPVYRIARDMSPALAMQPRSERNTRSNLKTDRELVVRFVAVARETDSDMVEIIADRLLVAAHAALMSDTSFGGLCLGVSELDTEEFEVEDADGEAAATPATYLFKYRTLAADISIQG